MTESIEKKQQFLRVQILDAGLDPSQFLEFLVAVNSKKGDNLDLWCLEELTQIVMAFKRSKNVPLNKSKISDYPNLQKTQPCNTYDDNLYVEDIKCLTKQQNKICAQIELKIIVSKFQIIEGGTFERKYVVYTVEVPRLKVFVNRRYSDFVWLRDVFGILYPGYPIPPVAKKGNFARYDEKYLTKKMLIIQKFLNTLTKIPQIYTDPLFQKFLYVNDPKEFQKYKSQFAKLSPSPISKIKTINGYVRVGTQKTLTNKIVKYQQYLKQTQPQTKKIYKNFKGAAASLEQASEFMKAIAVNCKFLRTKEEAIRIDLQLPPVSGYSPLFMIQNLTTEYSVQLIEQAKTFRREIYSTMKYESLYKLNMIEAMDQLSVKQQEYNNAKANLLKKKEKLYSDGKMDKWGLEVKINAKPQKQQAFIIMLPKQTKQLMALRQSYGLCNVQIFQECYRHTKYINLMLSTYIKQFMELQVKNLTQSASIVDQIYSRTKEVEKYHLQA